MRNITFRVSDKSKEDFFKQMQLETKLHTYLGTRHTNLHPDDWEDFYDTVYRFGLSDNEFVAFAECENKTIGYVEVQADYIDIKGKTYGVIANIYVEPQFRSSGVALTLFRMGVDLLLEHNVTRAVMNVGCDNPFRFLHYAVCDEVIRTTKQLNPDGTIKYNKLLAINDLRKIQNMSLIEICRKKREHQKNYEVHGMEMGEVAGW